jgi:hypothetical protein
MKHYFDYLELVENGGIESIYREVPIGEQALQNRSRIDAVIICSRSDSSSTRQRATKIDCPLLSSAVDEAIRKHEAGADPLPSILRVAVEIQGCWYGVSLTITIDLLTRFTHRLGFTLAHTIAPQTREYLGKNGKKWWLEIIIKSG